MGRKAAPSPPRTRLEEIRQERRMRSAELARRADMDPAALWRIETGKSALTAARRDPLARALMVSPHQLYAPIGSPIPFEPEDMPLETLPYEPAHAPPAVGERLRDVMADAGLSPAALAMAIGATEPVVFDWLEGRVLPPVPLMNRLANRVGITLGFLYYGDESGLLPGVAARLRAVRR
jgi:transcriptional regulator with XRE-family HTH domain